MDKEWGRRGVRWFCGILLVRNGRMDGLVVIVRRVRGVVRGSIHDVESFFWFGTSDIAGPQDGDVGVVVSGENGAEGNVSFSVRADSHKSNPSWVWQGSEGDWGGGRAVSWVGSHDVCSSRVLRVLCTSS